MLFDKSFLVHDLCEMFGKTLAEHTADCDWEPEFSIEGISSSGQEALIAAAEAYNAFSVETLNERAHQFVALCETGELEPSIVAGKVSDIYDSFFQRELQFYRSSISGLSQTDIELLERHNLEAFGIERPAVGGARREIETTLAARFPEEYRQEHLSNCTEAAENKGLPFRRFRREPYREDCSRTTNTVGPNGETSSSTMMSMAPGCATIEYYAQKPEMVGDKVIEED
jgi:hypothetical protein